MVVNASSCRLQFYLYPFNAQCQLPSMLSRPISTKLYEVLAGESTTTMPMTRDTALATSSNKFNDEEENLTTMNAAPSAKVEVKMGTVEEEEEEEEEVGDAPLLGEYDPKGRQMNSFVVDSSREPHPAAVEAQRWPATHQPPPLISTQLRRLLCIEREFYAIVKDPIEGIYITVSARDPLEWFGLLIVRFGIFAGGMFRFTLTLPTDFPDSQQLPAVRFEDPPRLIHPMIQPDTGQVDLRRLFPGGWLAPSTSISTSTSSPRPTPAAQSSTTTVAPSGHRGVFGSGGGPHCVHVYQILTATQSIFLIRGGGSRAAQLLNNNGSSASSNSVDSTAALTTAGAAQSTLPPLANPEAAQLLGENPTRFKQLAREAVRQSRSHIYDDPPAAQLDDPHAIRFPPWNEVEMEPVLRHLLQKPQPQQQTGSDSNRVESGGRGVVSPTLAYGGKKGKEGLSWMVEGPAAGEGSSSSRYMVDLLPADPPSRRLSTSDRPGAVDSYRIRIE